MIWNKHSDLIGKHAFLSGSKYHWINYDDDKLVEAYDKAMTAARGTRLHALAHDLISLGIKLPNTNQTLNMYVNDCIGYRMRTEQTLFHSYNAFGTADAIDFRERVLKIFDLKNGVVPTKETQLEVYAAFFCLEYKVRPAEIDYDLRIYQNDQIYRFDTDPEDIAYIMSRIIEFDKLIETMKEEV
jgi:hypothetical protein